MFLILAHVVAILPDGETAVTDLSPFVIMLLISRVFQLRYSNVQIEFHQRCNYYNAGKHADAYQDCANTNDFYHCPNSMRKCVPCHKNAFVYNAAESKTKHSIKKSTTLMAEYCQRLKVILNACRKLVFSATIVKGINTVNIRNIVLRGVKIDIQNQ